MYNGYKKSSMHIGGKELFFYEKGEGAVTCVFSCGWAVPLPFSDMFELADMLSSHCRCVIFDRFGYGFSELADGKRDFSAITQETKELCSNANITGNIVFIGHSLATFHALDFAKTYQGMLKGLVLIDCYFPDTAIGRTLFYVNKLIAYFFLLQKKLGLLNKMSDAQFRKVLFNKREITEAVLQDSIKMAKARAYNKTVRSELHYALKDLRHLKTGLDKVEDIPVTAICRNLTHKSILNLQKYMKNLHVVNMGKASHFIHHDYPGEVAEQIIKLCKK